MIIKLRKVKYRVRVRHLKGRQVGNATNPKHKKPVLIYDPAMFRKKALKRDLLEVLIHEALHGCFWDMDEDSIHESGVSIARFLKKVGVTCDPAKALKRLKTR